MTSSTAAAPTSAEGAAAATGAAALRRERARPRRWWADAVGAATVLSLTVVVGLWLSHGGVQDLGRGTASAMTSAGRLLGLVAADLLLLQCLMMARIPWAERSFGQDRLARWHRVVGFTSFWAMLAHIVTITLGYAAGESTGVLGEFWTLVTTYPGMLLAAAGTAALVMVVVTSIRRARARLRYESWHLLHLYAYLGVGLALPHQVWTGTDFVATPLARAYWWTLWIGAAAAIVVFRLALPLARSLHHDLRVADVVTERPGVVSVVLRGRHLERLPLEGGQFLTLRFLDGPGWTRANPYSLSAAPHPPWLRVTVQAVGDGSARLAALRPGTRVLFEGPFGRLTAGTREDVRRPLVLLACGVGVTPMRAILDELPSLASTTLVYRARSQAEVLFPRELADLAARGLRLHLLLGPRAGRAAEASPRTSWVPAGAEGDDVAVLRRLAPDIAEADVYVCGPAAWSAAAVAAARAVGVPRARIHLEDFSW